MSMTHSLPPRFSPLPLLGSVVPAWAAPVVLRAMKRGRDLRVVLAPWADHLWFASAVVTGLLIASWLASVMGLDLAPPAQEIFIL